MKVSKGRREIYFWRGDFKNRYITAMLQRGFAPLSRKGGDTEPGIHKTPSRFRRGESLSEADQNQGSSHNSVLAETSAPFT